MTTIDRTLAAVADLEQEAQARFHEVAKALHRGRDIAPAAILEALRASGRTRAELQAAVTDLAELAELAALEAERDRLNTRNEELRKLVSKHAANLERQKAEQAKIVAQFETAHAAAIAPLTTEIETNERATKEASDAHGELTKARTPDSELAEWAKSGSAHYQRMIDRVLEAREAREQKKNPKPWTPRVETINPAPQRPVSATVREARDGGWNDVQ